MKILIEAILLYLEDIDIDELKIWGQNFKEKSIKIYERRPKSI